MLLRKLEINSLTRLMYRKLCNGFNKVEVFQLKSYREIRSYHTLYIRLLTGFRDRR